MAIKVRSQTKGIIRPNGDAIKERKGHMQGKRQRKKAVRKGKLKTERNLARNKLQTSPSYENWNLPTIKDSSDHLQGFFRSSRILPTLYGLQNRCADSYKIYSYCLPRSTKIIFWNMSGDITSWGGLGSAAPFVCSSLKSLFSL